jgi:aromatic ring hydroxylase
VSTILEDVFVPWENVFMCGEYPFSGMLVERFACYHRQNYGGCKGGVSDIVIGAAATVADMSGYGRPPTSRISSTSMIHRPRPCTAALSPARLRASPPPRATIMWTPCWPTW